MNRFQVFVFLLFLSKSANIITIDGILLEKTVQFFSKLLRLPPKVPFPKAIWMDATKGTTATIKCSFAAYTLLHSDLVKVHIIVSVHICSMQFVQLVVQYPIASMHTKWKGKKTLKSMQNAWYARLLFLFSFSRQLQIRWFLRTVKFPMLPLMTITLHHGWHCEWCLFVYFTFCFMLRSLFYVYL